MSERTVGAIAVAAGQTSWSRESSSRNDGLRINTDGLCREVSSDSESSRTAEPRELVECVYISVVCAPCECVRVALAEEPKEKMIECPACGQLSFWTLLGRGATVRPLPFYQRLRLGEDRHRKNRVPWTEYDTYESAQRDRDERERREEEIDGI
jgi:hypothetical protein